MRTYGMPMPLRPKRSAQLKAHVPADLREMYEKFVSDNPRITLSDYVYSVLEEHAAMRIAKQTISRRGSGS